jgi:hypothetical protein
MSDHTDTLGGRLLADPDFTHLVGDVDTVLEVIGGDYPARALNILKPSGILVSTLPSTLAPLKTDAIERGIRLAGLLVEPDRLGMTALADPARTGWLMPNITAAFLPDQVAAALDQVRTGQDGSHPRLKPKQQKET